MEVDGWLSLRIPTAALAPMLCLRQRLSACFAAKVWHRLRNILCFRLQLMSQVLDCVQRQECAHVSSMWAVMHVSCMSMSRLGRHFRSESVGNSQAMWSHYLSLRERRQY